MAFRGLTFEGANRPLATGIICVIDNMTSKLLSGLAMAGLLAAPFPALAQDTAPDTTPNADLRAQASTNGLDIPDNVQLLRPNDPNMRKATATVNGQVITGTDVDQRLALIVSANQNAMQPAEMERLRGQVLRNLIDETLQIQEAKAQEIVITPEEIAQTYTRLAAQNFGQKTDAMDAYLLSINSSPVSLKRQIEGELAWQRLQRRNIAPFVNVSNEEVNELLKRLEASRGTDEYRLGEIYLSANAENRATVEANARQIVEQLGKGGSFVAYARQYSEASTAVVGGDLGFVRLGQLPAEMAAAAREMQTGQLVGPLEIPGGFTIMYLIDKKQVLMADPRDALLSLKQISIAFPENTTQAAANVRIEKFQTAIESIRGCGDAARAASEIGAEVVDNDQIRARSLPEQLQQVVLDLAVGQTTPPFGSVQDGVRVLLLCGRDDPAADAGPDFDQMMGQLEDERIAKRAQRYLRDLRNDAYIE